MKHRSLFLAAAAAWLVSCDKGPSKGPVQLKTSIDSVAYAIGTQVGANIRTSLRRAELDSADMELLLSGMRHALDSAVDVPQKDLDAAVERYMKAQRDKKVAKENAASEENLHKAQEWLMENGKKEGVITTASGLQYQVLTMGKGAKPTLDDKVEVHYRGALTDGQEFESSYSYGQPVRFSLNEVVPGWSEALQLMPAGSKWKVFVPPGLGYGARAGDKIPANSVLVFDMELLQILPKDAK